MQHWFLAQGESAAGSNDDRMGFAGSTHPTGDSVGPALSGVVCKMFLAL